MTTLYNIFNTAATTDMYCTITMHGQEYIMPSHIQLETVGSTCNASCSMCPKASWTRRPAIMSDATIETLVNQVQPYLEHVEFVSVFGHGEPLLDKNLARKIRLLKTNKFKGVGLATNCSLLDTNTSLTLMEAGLDTIIVSIDGASKATHEAIRCGTNFEEVVAKVRNFLTLRSNTYSTKVLIRFIKQPLNAHEVEDFTNYWSKYISPALGDNILISDVHNWGGSLEVMEANSIHPGVASRFRCKDLFSRLFIFANGDLALCCLDSNGFYDLGNIKQHHFLELYNSGMIKQYRDKMQQGLIQELEHCNKCSLPASSTIRASN